MFSHPFATMTENVIKHLARNIDASRGDAIAKFHSSVNLINQQALLRIFKYIDRQDTTTNSLCSS